MSVINPNLADCAARRAQDRPGRSGSISSSDRLLDAGKYRAAAAGARPSRGFIGMVFADQAAVVAKARKSACRPPNHAHTRTSLSLTCAEKVHLSIQNFMAPQPFEVAIRLGSPGR